MHRTRQLDLGPKIIQQFGFDTWVAQAVGTIRVPLKDNAPWLQSQLREIQLQIAELEDLRDKAKKYPVFNSHKAVSEPIFALRQQQKHIQMALKGYPATIDPTFLSWRQKGTDWPVFMLLVLDSPFVCLKSVGSWLNYVRIHEPAIPEYLMKQFDLTFQSLASDFLQYGDHVSFIRAEYSGLPGHETLHRIEKALSATNTDGRPLFDSVMIAAEAGEWKRSSTVFASLDPFVLGLVNATEQLYVIDIFNPTSIELAALNKHVSNLE